MENPANDYKNFPLVMKILENIKEVLKEDKAQKQPLFLMIRDACLLNIIRTAMSNPQKSFLIGISGESASGKTTLVQNAVKACIGDMSNLYTIVCCDDYYKDASQELKNAGNYEELFKTGFSFDTPKAFNLDIMKEHLITLKGGSSVRSPSYDFVTCESDPNGEIKKPSKLILNEGLYVLNDEIKDIMDVKVYVFTPFDMIKERWFKRAISRGKTGEAAKMQFEDVNITAQTYIRPAMQTADIVINGLTTTEYIEEITEKLLTAINSVIRESKQQKALND